MNSNQSIWQNETGTIDFNFEAKHGFITIRVNTESSGVFETYFSEVFDPLSDLKVWMESLAQSMRMGAIEVDMEGRYQTWYYQSDGNDIIFGFGDSMPDSGNWDRELDYLCKVNRRYFLRRFYHQWFHYFYSLAYHKLHWEKVTYREALLDWGKSNYLVWRLSRLTGKQLRGFFYYLDGIYKEEVSVAEIALLKERMLGQQTCSCAQKDYWSLPEGYDAMTRQFREEFVDRFLSEQINSCSGSNPLLLRSQIVEDFIYGK